MLLYWFFIITLIYLHCKNFHKYRKVGGKKGLWPNNCMLPKQNVFCENFDVSPEDYWGAMSRMIWEGPQKSSLRATWAVGQLEADPFVWAEGLHLREASRPDRRASRGPGSLQVLGSWLSQTIPQAADTWTQTERLFPCLVGFLSDL